MNFSYRNPNAGQDVFILGSGFSKAISYVMPLLRELTDPIVKRLNERRVSQAVPFLNQNGNAADVELAMTSLAQRHPWLSEAEYMDNRALSLYIAQAVGEEIEQRTLQAIEGQTCPGWLLRLVHWLHYRQAVVITLNYDTLLERAFGMIETGQTGSGERTHRYHLYSEKLHPISFLNKGQIGGSAAPSIELLKLHGSINWLYSGRTSFLGEQIDQRYVGGWKVEERDREPWRKRTSRVPLIVPPVADKAGYFENEDVRFLWKRAAEALRDAKRIFCLGYSLPATDLTMRFLLHSSNPGRNVDFYVVNSAAAAAEHYRSLLPPWFQVNNDNVGEGGIESLPDALFASNWAEVVQSNEQHSYGPVEQAIRSRAPAGTRLRTCEEPAEFEVATADDSGLTLLLGAELIPARFPWDALEGVVPLLESVEAREPARPFLEIAGHDFVMRGEPESLDAYLKQWVNRATARWVAALLSHAGVVVIERPSSAYVIRLKREVAS